MAGGYTSPLPLLGLSASRPHGGFNSPLPWFGFSGYEVVIEPEEPETPSVGGGGIGADAWLELDRLKHPEEYAETERLEKEAEKEVIHKAALADSESIANLLKTEQLLTRVKEQIAKGLRDKEQADKQRIRHLQWAKEALEARQTQERALIHAMNNDDAVLVLLLNEIQQENAVIDYVLNS